LLWEPASDYRPNQPGKNGICGSDPAHGRHRISLISGAFGGFETSPPWLKIVLTACRIWRFRDERSHSSNTAAGRWALAQDPALPALGDALRRRAGEEVRIEPAEIGRLLSLVRKRIAADVVAGLIRAETAKPRRTCSL
jgi:hypothetical protein